MHLGRAGERAGRKGCLEHVHAGHAIEQRAFDIAHDVHHMAVALHAKSLGDLDRANLGNAANVVACQVDQHHMLGALLGVVDQLHLGDLVQFSAGAARAGAGERADGDFLLCFAVQCDLLLAYQNLGRSPHHMEITKVVVIHIGAGVERTQRPVQAQRRLGVALLDALAHLHLHEVAASNQLLGALHGGNVVGLGKVALGGVTLRGLDGGCTDRVLQLFLQLTQALFGVGKGLGAGRVGIDNQVQLAGEVVDDRQLLALQQQDVGAAQGVGWARRLQLFLDVAHRVVTKVTGQATAKARQAGAQRHLEAFLVVRDEVQRVDRGGFHHHTVGHHLGAGVHAKTHGTHQRAGRQTNEAVAAKALTAHHRFQQKAVFASVFGVRQLEVQRQGRFQVGKGLRHQGNAVVALGAQAFEFEFRDHGWVSFNSAPNPGGPSPRAGWGWGQGESDAP